MNRKDEGLQQLGQNTQYRQDYAPEVLETFQNRHPDNDYWVRFNCPESLRSALLQVSPTLPRYASATFPTSAWSRAKA